MLYNLIKNAVFRGWEQQQIFGAFFSVYIVIISEKSLTVFRKIREERFE